MLDILFYKKTDKNCENFDKKNIINSAIPELKEKYKIGKNDKNVELNDNKNLYDDILISESEEDLSFQNDNSITNNYESMVEKLNELNFNQKMVLFLIIICLILILIRLSL